MCTATRLRLGLVLLVQFGMATSASAQLDIVKPPDLGAFWNPLSNGATTVYAGSFIAPADNPRVDELGIWMQQLSPIAASIIALQVWGGGDAGPDHTDVIATTANFSSLDPNFNLHVHPVVQQIRPLIAGQRYWFVADASDKGTPFLGAYKVGAHTQNSVYDDNGTFWYSNDPHGETFDGQNWLPEMAFRVHLSPEPATILLLAAGVAVRRVRRWPGLPR